MIRFQQTPDSFFVEEIPLYEPSGQGRYVFLRIRKRDCSTMEAKRRIARWAGVNKDKIRHAGMKDRASTSTQWLSWDAGGRPLPMDPAPDLIEILDCSYHENNLSVGHLSANRFRIILDCQDEIISEERLALPFPNYYGPQRFGRMDTSKEAILQRIAKPARDRHLISVIQAWFFNQYLQERLNGEAWQPSEQELWTKSNGKRVFQCPWEDVSERFDTGEVMPTGPVFGYKMQTTTEEESWLGNLGLEKEAFRAWGSIAKGARRPILARPIIHGVQTGEDKLSLDFTLPSGVYATVFLTHLFKPWLLNSGQTMPDFTESVVLSDR